jgi:MFS family permease
MLLAAVIDSLGSGLFLPIAVVYFLRTTTLQLATVGLGLSAGSALVIPLLPAAGWAVDRFGAIRCVVAANVLQMAGFVAYLWVSELWQLIASALLVAAGGRLFWTTNGAFVQMVAKNGERARWFGLLRALRNGGYALGGALSSIALGLGTQRTYHALVVLNAASFLAAGLLVATWSLRQPTTQRAARRSNPVEADADPGGPRKRSGYRAVLADRPFLLLMAANLGFVLCGLALDVLLTVYVTRTLHRQAWLAGALFTLSCVLVIVTQTMTTRRTEHHRRTGVLQLAALLWATSFLLLWVLAAAPAPTVIPALILAIVFYTAAEIVCLPTINELVMVLAPTQRQGRYFAVQGLSWVVPGAIAPAAFTWLLSRGTAWPWIVLIVVSAASTAAMSRLGHMLTATTDLSP